MRVNGSEESETCAHSCVEVGAGETVLQGYLVLKKTPPSQDHGRALGIFLLSGPAGGCFLMSEVPLYDNISCHPALSGTEAT